MAVPDRAAVQKVAYTRHEVRLRDIKSHRHGGQGARRQHVVGVNPRENIPGGASETLGNGIALPFVRL